MPTPIYHRPEHWDHVHVDRDPHEAAGASHVLWESVRAVVDQRLRGTGTLLDIGCGTGALLGEMPAGLRRIGMDFSPEALRVAASTDTGAGAGADDGSRHRCGWVRAEAERIPLAGASLDAALCVSTLWAFADPVRVLDETARVLRPGGLLVLHLWGRPTDCRLITLGAAVIGRVIEGARLTDTVTGPFELTPARVGTWLRDAGFGAVDWQRSHCRRPIADTAAYWAEFASLAPTSYDAYRRATEPERRRVRGLLGSLLDQSRRQRGDHELDLTWWLGVARYGSHPTGPARDEGTTVTRQTPSDHRPEEGA
jgi:SAM-dependent methyltransferase